VVETINQSYALIEKFLRLFAFCVNRMMLPPYSGNRQVDGLCFLVLVLSRSEWSEQQ
jgi:hypothetical protein